VAAGDHTCEALAKLAVGHAVTTEDDNPCTDSPHGCGGKSQYYVT
jgi:hypothetical protein